MDIESELPRAFVETFITRFQDDELNDVISFYKDYKEYSKAHPD